MMVPIGFLIGHSQDFASSLSEFSQRMIWPWSHAHDNPLTLNEVLDTCRGEAVFSSNAVRNQFASRDQSPDRHRIDPQQFCDLFCRQKTFHKFLLSNLNEIYRTKNSIHYFEIIYNLPSSVSQPLSLPFHLSYTLPIERPMTPLSTVRRGHPPSLSSY